MTASDEVLRRHRWSNGRPTHRAKSVARFVAAQTGKLALVFLPPYSLDLNPDEFVWNDLRNHGLGLVGTIETDGRLAYAATAKTTRSGTQFLSRASYALCTRAYWRLYWEG